MEHLGILPPCICSRGPCKPSEWCRPARSTACPLSAVFDAVLRSVLCGLREVSINQSLSFPAVQDTELPCIGKACAGFHSACLRAAATMPCTETSCLDSSGALAEGAEPFGAVNVAQPTSANSCIAPFSRAKPACPVLLATASCVRKPAAACNRARL